MTRLLRILPFLTVVLAAEASSRPNILFLLADDLGYADIGCYGSPDAKTPHLDQLAAEGVRFTQVYANGPECTPSRTAILTGSYPQRIGGLECAIGTGNVGRYDDAIALAARDDLGLPPHEAVLAPALKSAGYRTAVYGKWHLGYEPKFNPLNQGFDDFTGFLGGNVEYFRHFELSDIPVYYDRRKPVDREGYLTHLITGDAIAFLETHRAERPEQPFFLYVPHAAPHFPFQAPEDREEPPPTAETWTEGTRATYVKMLEDLDAEIGRLLDALEATGFAEDTLVVFASDHGAMPPGLNTPWRDFKGTLFDGGIRVPLIARWPGHLPAGTENGQLGCLLDLTRSFLRIAEAPVPEGAELDGIDLLRRAEEALPGEPRTLFWRSKRGDRTWWAVRDEVWKYVRRKDADTEEWLFHLKSDPHETNNLVATRPDELRRLRSALANWETAVQAPRP